jgi:uncharacterized protein
VKVLRQADYSAQPWKNGGGTLRLVAASPAEAGYSAALDWQVGIPTIERDGPFSPLPGLDRQWLMLEGDGVSLDCRPQTSDKPVVIGVGRVLEPIAFSGDWATSARLTRGPVTGLSVLSRRGAVAAILDIIEIRGTVPIEKPAGEVLLLFVAKGSVRAFASGAAVSVDRLDTALFSDPGYAACTLSVAGWANSATVVRIRLTRL